MGEGKPLGACASWTIAFGPVFAAAGREPGAGPTEVPARLPLAFGSLCASLRFPVLKDLRNRALPSGQPRLFGSCGIYRIKGFAPQAVLLVEGQAVGWKGNVLAGIPEDDIRRVREASDLVSIAGERVVLRQRGRDFWGCCPFHNEKSPSFKIDPSTQLWHCFGCGEGGDVFSFVMKLDDIGFVDAVRELARRAGIQITEAPGAAMNRGKKARLKEVCNASAEFFHTQLMRGRGPKVDEARSYLAGRDLGGGVPKKWQLGFAPGSGSLVAYLGSKGFKAKEMIEANVAVEGRGGARDRFFDRIMFPIRDVDGDVIAFGGRVVGKGEPKYLNSQETPIFHKSEVLFGLDKAKAAMASTGVAIICEGYTDVIMMHEAGVTNVVATLGTALTVQHIRVLSRHAKHKIVYLFDGDEAGQRAADRAARFIDESMLPEAGRKQVDLCAVTLPDNLDPADFVVQRGGEAIQELIDNAVPLLRYAIDRKLRGRNLVDFGEKGRALTEVLELLAPIKHSVLAQEYAGYIADCLQLDVNAVVEKLASTRETRQFEPSQASAGAAAPAPRTPKVALPPREKERLRIERDFLSLCASEPSIGLAYAGALAQTVWHRDIHGQIATQLLDVLAENAAAPAAEIVRRLEESIPGAASVISGSSTHDDREPGELARFFSEELAIRDMEDLIREMNAQLKRPQDMSADDYNLVFESVVAMQKELAAAKLAHKPFGIE